LLGQATTKPGLATTLLLVLAAAAPATAIENQSPMPPEDVRAHDDEGENVLDLVWADVDDDRIDAYQVDENGHPLTTTNDSQIQIRDPTPGDVFWITSIAENGEESPPSEPILFDADCGTSGPCLTLALWNTQPAYVDPNCVLEEVLVIVNVPECLVATESFLGLGTEACKAPGVDVPEIENPLACLPDAPDELGATRGEWWKLVASAADDVASTEVNVWRSIHLGGRSPSC